MIMMMMKHQLKPQKKIVLQIYKMISTDAHTYRYLVSSLTQGWIKSIRLKITKNGDKTESKCFNKDGSTLSFSGKLLKLVDQFIYLGSTIPSTESNIDSHIHKAWIAIDRLLTIWKFELSYKIRRILPSWNRVSTTVWLYGFTTWTLRKHLEKEIRMNHSGMLYAVFNNYLKPYDRV